jgi:thiamine pyrophosphate-dependent acetolactate synthase large subunit-like protein
MLSAARYPIMLFGSVHLPFILPHNEAFGAKGIRLEEPGDVEEALTEALAYKDGPVVVDAVVDPSHFRSRRTSRSTRQRVTH